jgi:hypothetical protein
LPAGEHAFSAKAALWLAGLPLFPISLGEQAFDPIEQGAVIIGFAEQWALFAQITYLLRRTFHISGQNNSCREAVVLYPSGKSEAVERARTVDVANNHINFYVAII